MVIHDPMVIAVAEERLSAVPESADCCAANDGSRLPVLPAVQYFSETLAREHAHLKHHARYGHRS